MKRDFTLAEIEILGNHRYDGRLRQCFPSRRPSRTAGRRAALVRLAVRQTTAGATRLPAANVTAPPVGVVGLAKAMVAPVMPSG
jgi:hypothetical protein